MVSFDYKLETGNIVDIKTTNSAAYGPNRNWLEMAKTNQAKVKIRAWFRKERRPENISEGKNMLEKEMKRNNLPFSDEDLLSAAANELRYENTEEFFASIGYGGVQMTRVMHKLKEVYAARTTEADGEESFLSIEDIDLSESIARKQSKGVIVENVDNCLVRFANCCTPLPGDEIIGFITRGYGVSVHKSDCMNINTENSKERLIGVEWASSSDLYYRAAIDIIAEDRNALIADVTSVISESRYSISEFAARRLKNGNACIEVSVEIANVEQLKNILAKLQKIPGVLAATRRDS
jgi:GTP pyrophosphokinase